MTSRDEDTVEHALVDVERRNVPDQFTAVSSATVELAEIGPWVSAAFGRVAAALASQRIQPTGPPYVRYFPLGDRRFRVEAGFPVQQRIDSQADVTPATLPAGPVLVTVHAGSYDSVSESYERIDSWASERGVTTSSSPWEVYLTDPSANPDPSTWRTEVFVPVVPS